MNILLGVHQFFPDSYAGTERYVLNLAKVFQSWGHRVSVLTYDHPQEATEGSAGGQMCVREYTYDGIRVTAFSHAASPDFNFDLDNETFYRAALQFLKQQSFDLYHCAHPLHIGASLRAARDSGVPVVLTLTDFWLMCPRGILLRADNTQCQGPDGGRRCRRHCFWLKSPEEFDRRTVQAKELMLHADCVLAPSLFLIGVFQYNSFPRADAIRLSRHGFDYGIAETMPTREVDPESITIGYIGTIQFHKGVHVLISAFRKVRSPRLRLRIWGGCLHETTFGAYVRTLAAKDPRIELCGEYDHSDILRVLEGIDLVVVPSLWYENAPLTITTSHAFGRPVIASDVGGMAEMVRSGEDGLTFRVGDANSLAERLSAIAANPGLINQFRRALVPPPRLEEEAFRMERLYRSLVVQRQESPAAASA